MIFKNGFSSNRTFGWIFGRTRQFSIRRELKPDGIITSGLTVVYGCGECRATCWTWCTRSDGDSLTWDDSKSNFFGTWLKLAWGTIPLSCPFDRNARRPTGSSSRKASVVNKCRFQDLAVSHATLMSYCRWSVQNTRIRAAQKLCRLCRLI